MACLGPGARCAAFACGAARIFRATRPASRRASAPPPSPTERFEDQEALNPSQARNRQNYQRDAVPSRRTGNYRAKLDFRLERRSSLLQRWNFTARIHNQLDVINGACAALICPVLNSSTMRKLDGLSATTA